MIKLRTLIARFILAISGWTLVGERPSEKKIIVLAGPHTSLIDGFWMVLAAFGLGLQVSYLVKSVYTKGFFGPLVLWSGGIPVLSGAGANKVAEVIDLVNAADAVELLLAPAGTRTKRDSWRSGFFHIAKATNIPIYISFLDFKTREMGIMPEAIRLTDDTVKDMDKIRALYAGKMGKHPEKMTRIHIREEDDASL